MRHTSTVRSVLLSLAFAPALACGGTTEGSGDYAEANRMLPAFDALALQGLLAAEINVDPGVAADRAEVTVSGDDNLVWLVKLEVNEYGALVGSTEEELLPKLPLRISIRMHDLIGVKAEDTARIAVYGLSANHFDVNAVGATTVAVSGTAKLLDVSVEDEALFDGTYLEAEEAYVRAIDNSHVNVCANKKLVLNNEGTPKIDLICVPVVVM